MSHCYDYYAALATEMAEMEKTISTSPVVTIRDQMQETGKNYEEVKNDPILKKIRVCSRIEKVKNDLRQLLSDINSSPDNEEHIQLLAKMIYQFQYMGTKSRAKLPLLPTEDCYRPMKSYGGAWMGAFREIAKGSPYEFYLGIQNQNGSYCIKLLAAKNKYDKHNIVDLSYLNGKFTAYKTLRIIKLTQSPYDDIIEQQLVFLAIDIAKNAKLWIYDKRYDTTLDNNPLDQQLLKAFERITPDPRGWLLRALQTTFIRGCYQWLEEQSKTT